jgi:branched-chain amino acid transport system ATP-binding protein
MSDALLEVRDVSSGYGQLPVLRDVNVSLNAGEAIAVIGPNGAGKSTFLKTVCGMLKPARGTIAWDGVGIGGKAPHRIVASGLSHVQEGRALFWNLTVLENLQLGGYVLHRRDRARYANRLAEMFDLFPTLSERRQQRAGTLSGGEQQMLAIARGLIREPRLLMLDEPSLGLAPIMISRIYAVIRKLKSSGMALIIVEPQPQHVLSVADRVVMFDRGRVAEDVARAEFGSHGEDLLAAYLGGKQPAHANGHPVVGTAERATSARPTTPSPIPPRRVQ